LIAEGAQRRVEQEAGHDASEEADGSQALTPGWGGGL